MGHWRRRRARSLSCRRYKIRRLQQPLELELRRYDDRKVCRDLRARESRARSKKLRYQCRNGNPRSWAVHLRLVAWTYLVYREGLDSPIVQNRSGLDLEFVYKDGDRVLKVMNIRPGTPASVFTRSGLHVGQTITGIDSKPVDSIDQWEVISISLEFTATP